MNSTDANWSDYLEHVALTDVGMRRANNQDSYAVALAADTANWFERGHMFLVADGMGAHAAGELASKLAADGIPHTYHKLRELSPPDALRKAMENANAQINQRGQANSDFHGMGTTCCALVLLPHGALVGHVGDSRVYRLRKNKLEQLTFDHSLVWEMMAAGQLSKDAVPGFVRKNIITRSLGPHPRVQVDLEGPFPLEVGDTFLLCSDGLSGLVTDEEIGVLLGCLPPADAARVLIDVANLRGGNDNITVVIARVVGEAMTTAAVTAANPLEPLKVSPQSPPDKPPKNSGHPALWIAAGVALLAAMIAAVLHFTLPALLLAVVGIIVAVVAAVQRFGGEATAGLALSPGARLGNGPYVAVQCTPNPEFVGVLADFVEQLREAANESKFALDWSRFDVYRRHGVAAAERKEYRQAVCEYSRAIRFMLSELRNQAARRPQPNGTDLDVV